MKNYNTNNAIKLCSAEIAKIKARRHELKERLNYGIGKISLGNFDQKMEEARSIMKELQVTKNKIMALRELNKRYMMEANDGKFPVSKRVKEKFIDFTLSRDDVILLVSSLTSWLEQSKGKPCGKQTMLSILGSKLAKQSLTSQDKGSVVY